MSSDDLKPPECREGEHFWQRADDPDVGERERERERDRKHLKGSA